MNSVCKEPHFNTTFSILIEGELFADSRPRKGKTWSGKSVFYNPKSAIQKKIKELLRNQLIYKFPDIPLPFFKNEPIAVTILFNLKPSDNWKRQFKLNKVSKHPTVKPDIDNTEKFYLDCMNKIIYQDDKNVIEVYKLKQYSEEEYVIILVSHKDIGHKEDYKLINIKLGENAI